MRLDRFLANSGKGTRSEVKKLISSGKVSVNGQIIKDAGYQLKGSDSVTVGESSVSGKTFLYYLLDKPDQVLTAMEDKRLKCVGDLIPASLKGRKLSPVGRLDYHTTGLLLITNDGELSHRITSPRYRIEKVYKVTYSGGSLSEEHVREAAGGIVLTDTDKQVKLAPAGLELISEDTCLITLTEGKTHEVRRILSHFGREVIELRRIKLGNLELNEVLPGELRELTEEELTGLLALTSLEPSPRR